MSASRIKIKDGSSGDPIEENFGKFREQFKFYTKEKLYEEFEDVDVYFNSKTLELADTHNVELINEEINAIARKIFMFGMILESQTQIVQMLQDKIERWRAEKYLIVDNDYEDIIDKSGNKTKKKISRTETAKEYLIINKFSGEYDDLTKGLRNEEHKLRLIKRTVSSLENYSYKLHSLQDYRKTALTKGL